MAMSISRAVSSFSRKLLNIVPRDTRNVLSLAESLGVRSASVLSRTQSVIPQNVLKHLTPSAKVQYCGLHTEGDCRFVELLDDEIVEEKKRLVAIPAMSDGWKVSFNGASGTLTKNHNGDNVEVSFTFNGSLAPMDEGEEDEDSPIVSYPDFNVKITKPGNSKTVEFECYFPDDVQEGVVDESMNIFSIRNAIIYEGEFTDETYLIDTENLDPNVYSFFMSYLADRDIDQQFANEFIAMTTAAEQKEYVKSLQLLQDFIASK